MKILLSILIVFCFLCIPQNISWASDWSISIGVPGFGFGYNAPYYGGYYGYSYVVPQPYYATPYYYSPTYSYGMGYHHGGGWNNGHNGGWGQNNGWQGQHNGGQHGGNSPRNNQW